ncbi:MAG: flagellar biosynthesis protein FliQ [Alphaproteobacteria bacterium]|nr:flagellar biosynthesis protein FliQ [Alphaproteobacteria bacterium]
MDVAAVLDVSRDAVIVLLKLSAPLMLTALVIGLIVSLFQALTQIQEMTLAFVPKILVVFVSLLIFLPFMLSTLITFTEGLADRIIGIG